jgi:hypothetical protein
MRLRSLLFACVTAVTAQCHHFQPAAPWSPPEEDAEAIDGRADAISDAHTINSTDISQNDSSIVTGEVAAARRLRERRCVSHALPPEDLGAAPTDDGGVSIAFSGRAWGVAWTEHVDGEDAVYFAAVGEHGRRIGTPTRVTERGYRGRHPSLVWTGEQWMIVSSSGSARYDELWVQRLNERGVAVSRARRITGRDRFDRHPALAAVPSGGYVLAWATELELRRHKIMAVRLGAWGQQLAPPIELVERTSRLSDVAVTARGNEVIVSWSAMRPTTFAIEAVRLDPLTQSTAGVARIVSAPHGLADRAPRGAVVNTAGTLTFAWEQWAHGASGVRLVHFGRRLRGALDNETISVEDEGATLLAPALATLDDGAIVLATQRSVGELDHSVLIETRSVDDRQLGPRIRVRGHEGVAERPLLSLGNHAIAVVTRGPRGLALHRVPIVECP